MLKSFFSCDKHISRLALKHTPEVQMFGFKNVFLLEISQGTRIAFNSLTTGTNCFILIILFKKKKKISGSTKFLTWLGLKVSLTAGQTDERTDKQTGGLTNGGTNSRTERQTDVRTNRQPHREADRQTYVRTDRRTKRETDERTDSQPETDMLFCKGTRPSWESERLGTDMSLHHVQGHC